MVGCQPVACGIEVLLGSTRRTRPGAGPTLLSGSGWPCGSRGPVEGPCVRNVPAAENLPWSAQPCNRWRGSNPKQIKVQTAAPADRMAYGGIKIPGACEELLQLASVSHRAEPVETGGSSRLPLEQVAFAVPWRAWRGRGKRCVRGPQGQ